MRVNGQIDYVEFPGRDIGRMANFYGSAFGWTFEPRGHRCSTAAGPFPEAALSNNEQVNAWQPLVMLYVDDLEAAQRRVEEAGGTVLRPIFRVPGGRRFHFRDPEGNELGVWSDVVVTPPEAPRRCLRQIFAELWPRAKARVSGRHRTLVEEEALLAA